MPDSIAINEKVYQELKNAFLSNKLGHAYLFVDPSDELALNTSYALAQEIFNEKSLDRIRDLNHPDFALLDFGDKTIKIDEIRGLKQELSKSPMEASQRVFVINHAENLTLNSANALLNLLEEPVASVVTILIVKNQSQILPTIKSRTQIVNFAQDEMNVNPDLENASEIRSLAAKFAEQLVNFDPNSILTAKEIQMAAPENAIQQYFFNSLADFADDKLHQNQQINQYTYLLRQILVANQMRQQNVSFINVLNYIIIQMKESR